MVQCNKFLYNKTNRHNNFPNLFWLKNEPLHVSGSSSAHHQKFIHCTLGTGICHTGLKTAFQLSNLYDIYQCQVYSEWTSDDGQTNCLKHVKVHFLAKINLGNYCICWFYYKEIRFRYLEVLMFNRTSEVYINILSEYSSGKHRKLEFWK